MSVKPLPLVNSVELSRLALFEPNWMTAQPSTLGVKLPAGIGRRAQEAMNRLWNCGNQCERDQNRLEKIRDTQLPLLASTSARSSSTPTPHRRAGIRSRP